jgi:hypothetical protein
MAKLIQLVCETGANPSKWGNRTAPRPEETARRGQPWQLALEDRAVRLLDREGREVVVFPREEAEYVFQIPGIFQVDDFRNLGLATAEETFWFRPDRDAIRQFQAYLDESLVLQGPDAIDAYQSRARREFVVGLMGLIGGPLAAYYGFQLLGSWHIHGKLAVLPIAFAVIGLLQFGRGCRAMLRVSRLRAIEERSLWG